MKIALCLFGHIGGMKSKGGSLHGDVDVSRAYSSYKKMILMDNDVDVFIHSWSIDSKEELINLYTPNDSLIEKQKDFSSTKLEDYSMKHFDTYTSYFATYKEKTVSVLQDTMMRSCSRWYSNSKSLELMSLYSKKNNISYDYVFQGRLDLLLFKKINFNELDKKYYYSPIRSKEKGKALNEYFMISNQKNAEIFSSIYREKNKYSIRPPVAAKQHLDDNLIETKECSFELAKDFNTLRNQVNKENNEQTSVRLYRIIKNPSIIIVRIYKIFRSLILRKS